jgi:hypothetical protein
MAFFMAVVDLNRRGAYVGMHAFLRTSYSLSILNAPQILKAEYGIRKQR